jgi:hypothetical protein
MDKAFSRSAAKMDSHVNQQFLLNVTQMLPTLLEDVHRAFGNFYTMVDRHHDILSQLQAAKPFIIDHGVRDMADDAAVLSRYKTMACSAMGFVADFIEWYRAHMPTLISLEYNWGDRLSAMPNTISLGAIHVGFVIIDRCWTTILDAAIRDDTIASKDKQLDRLKDTVTEVHNAHASLRTIIAELVKEACSLKGFQMEDVEKLIALPRFTETISADKLRTYACAILSQNRASQSSGASIDEQIRSISDLADALRRLAGSRS